MSNGAHWEKVYREKNATEVSWHRTHLDCSLGLIERCGLPTSATIVDVGGGAATLVDDLLERGFVDLSVIDISAAALEQAKTRLGDRAGRVRWLVGDATQPILDEDSVDLWHDRAVFHFLTDPADRAAYVSQVGRCVRPGGYVLIGTFAPDGPERCSGLPVVRYSPQDIIDILGAQFQKVAEAREVHETPWKSTQAFSYVLCRFTP